MKLLLRPSAHVEVFNDGKLIHSSRPDEILSRPCCVCGQMLGVKSPVVLIGERHAHEDCGRRMRHGR